MTQPELLDVCSGAGGCTKGYQRAGFRVTGVDNRPQPRYAGDEFILADALDVLADIEFLRRFDVVHTSPPCQRWAEGADWHGNDYPDLITPIRPLLEAAGIPYVIENVPEAPLRPDVILCGTQFGLQADGFEVRRHRAFEISHDIWFLAPPCQHRLPAMPIFGHNPNGDFYKRHGRGLPIDAKRRGMGIDWMNREIGRAH